MRFLILEVCIIFICFMIALCLASGKEGKENEEESFKEFCKSLNLVVDVHPDSERCTLAVYFELENSTHVGCFHFFDIYLIRKKKEISIFRVKYDDINGKAFHKFQNITSGVYEIFIKPYCSFKKCPRLEIEYGPLIDMTNSVCISNRNETYRTSGINETPTTSVTRKIYPVSLIKEAHTSSVYETYTSPPNVTVRVLTKEIHESEHQNSLKQKIIIIVVIVILLLIICMLIYLKRRKKKQSLYRTPDITSNQKDNSSVLQNTDIKIEVYIFHYYDRKGKMKKKVEIIKDFLLKLSYFSCVKGIDDELAVILFNVNNWLNDVLDKRRKDGTVKRVILITSQEENEPDDDEDGEIENQIYSSFLKKINNKDEQFFTCNDNIYFVQFDNSIIHSVRFGNIIWQHQYSLCGESTLDHMMDLCLNLCSGLKLETHVVEKRIRELFMNHPVRHFGNSLKLVECI